MLEVEQQMPSTAKAGNIPGATELTETQRDLIKARRQAVIEIIKEGRVRYLKRQSSVKATDQAGSWITKHLKRK